jgi:hypothetical protein
MVIYDVRPRRIKEKPKKRNVGEQTGSRTPNTPAGA